MKNIILLFFLLFVWPLVAQAQDTEYQSMNAEANNQIFWIQYQVHTSNPQGKQVALKDFVLFHLNTYTENDSLLKSTYPNRPITKELSTEDPRYATEGFLRDMLLKLRTGDSATFLVNSDDLFQAIKRRRPPFIAPGSNLKYVIKVEQILTHNGLKRKKADEAFKTKEKDEKVLAPYASKNFSEAKRTYSGVWYEIQVQGEGDFPKANDVVAIAYREKLMDGTTFRSSDKDGRLLEFPVGQGFVIKGLDESILLLKQGAKATFLLPSSLAYGQKGWNDVVAPNTPIMVEVEFIDIVSKQLIYEIKPQGKQNLDKRLKELDQEKLFKQIEKDVKKKSVNIK